MYNETSEDRKKAGIEPVSESLDRKHDFQPTIRHWFKSGFHVENMIFPRQGLGHDGHVGSGGNEIIL
jgi:hypothetical protein